MGRLSKFARRLHSGSKEIDLLAYPPPARCWLALSNDPDNTTIEAWEELHTTIWSDLALPFEDSLFVANHCDVWPDQVNLESFPKILSAHRHDTIHTWGDYTKSKSYLFTRADAQKCLEILNQHNFTPRVWTDHANFSGNLTHRVSVRPVPRYTDISGREYENYQYSTDLIHRAGVRYVWDGTLQDSIWGQDRPISRDEWYTHSPHAKTRLSQKALSRSHGLLRPVSRYLNPAIFTYHPDGNRQYYPHTFLDGHKFYLFPRFGRWGLADIDGFGELAKPENLDRLAALGGTSIIYTHLGKRNASRAAYGRHIPEKTHRTLRNLADRQKDGEIRLSSTSALLDYLVLRDCVLVEDDRIDFQPDGIRFETLDASDLRGHAFGVYSRRSDFTVNCMGQPIASTLEQFDRHVYRLSFAPTLPQ